MYGGRAFYIDVFVCAPGAEHVFRFFNGADVYVSVPMLRSRDALVRHMAPLRRPGCVLCVVTTLGDQAIVGWPDLVRVVTAIQDVCQPAAINVTAETLVQSPADGAELVRALPPAVRALSARGADDAVCTAVLTLWTTRAIRHPRLERLSLRSSPLESAEWDRGATPSHVAPPLACCARV